MTRFNIKNNGRKFVVFAESKEHAVTKLRDSLRDTVSKIDRYKNVDIWKDEAGNLYADFTIRHSGKRLADLKTKDINRAKQIIDDMVSFLTDSEVRDARLRKGSIISEGKDKYMITKISGNKYEFEPYLEKLGATTNVYGTYSMPIDEMDEHIASKRIKVIHDSYSVVEDANTISKWTKKNGTIESAIIRHGNGYTFYSAIIKEDKDFGSLDEAEQYAKSLGYTKKQNINDGIKYIVEGYYDKRDFEPSYKKSFSSESSALKYKRKLEESGVCEYVTIIERASDCSISTIGDRTSNIESLVKDLVHNDQIRISNWTDDGKITLDSDQLYSTDINQLCRVIKQRGYDCKILNTRTVKVSDELVQSGSEEAFKKNISTEIRAGKDPKQAAAIAYNIQRENDSKVKDSIALDIVSEIKKYFPNVQISTRVRKLNSSEGIINEWSININNAKELGKGFEKFIQNLKNKYRSSNKAQINIGTNGIYIIAMADSSIKDSSDYTINYRNSYTGERNKETIKANSAIEAIKKFADAVALRGWGTRNIDIISISPNDGYVRLYGKLSDILRQEIKDCYHIDANDSRKYYTIGGYAGKYDPQGLADIKKAAKYGVSGHIEKTSDGYQLVLSGEKENLKNCIENYFGLDSTGISDENNLIDSNYDYIDNAMIMNKLPKIGEMTSKYNFGYSDSVIVDIKKTGNKNGHSIYTIYCVDKDDLDRYKKGVGGTYHYTAAIKDKSVFSKETMNSVQEGIEKDYASMRKRISQMKDELEKLNSGYSEIEDDRLSPMTYVKLKELGYSSDDWEGWTQEYANKVVEKSGKDVSEKEKTDVDRYQEYRNSLSKEELEKQAKDPDSELGKLAEKADIRAGKIKNNELEKASKNFKRERVKENYNTLKNNPFDIDSVFLDKNKLKKLGINYSEDEEQNMYAVQDKLIELSGYKKEDFDSEGEIYSGGLLGIIAGGDELKDFSYMNKNKLDNLMSAAITIRKILDE